MLKLFLFAPLLVACSDYSKQINEDNNSITEIEQISFGLLEVYSEKSGSYPSGAFGYIESCKKLSFDRKSILSINDTLMTGRLYSCNYTKNFKSITNLNCDSTFSYKFYFDEFNILDFELLNFLKNNADSIIYLKIDNMEVYRDSLKKTLIVYDAPYFNSNLEDC